MIKFSRVDTKERLIEAIAAIPADEANPALAEDLTLAKQDLVNKLNRLTTTGAHVNLTINQINQWCQTDIQVSGQNVIRREPQAAPAPVAGQAAQ